MAPVEELINTKAVKLLVVAFAIFSVVRGVDYFFSGKETPALLSCVAFALVAFGLYTSTIANKNPTLVGRVATIAGIAIGIASIAMRHWP